MKATWNTLRLSRFVQLAYNTSQIISRTTRHSAKCTRKMMSSKKPVWKPRLSFSVSNVFLYRKTDFAFQNGRSGKPFYMNCTNLQKVDIWKSRKLSLELRQKSTKKRREKPSPTSCNNAKHNRSTSHLTTSHLDFYNIYNYPQKNTPT